MPYRLATAHCRRANGGTQTRDLLITNQLLYHLSYISKLILVCGTEGSLSWYGFTVNRFFMKLCVNADILRVFRVMDIISIPIMSQLVTTV